ncbi:DUF1501 domain-containing protein [Prosthecobacter sp.]|uniref:DUF1501 domain-containing protein n=1 Tax=Prosthecobacter sp. TaxID=1965333 RepID=UPI002ABB038A|nr:DUF1501 domain-containing protein [Prosthecobacter sp.]MDZ4405880.1 DUF1501 domain-containing protein [Prosthecobacter sp.]
MSRLTHNCAGHMRRDFLKLGLTAAGGGLGFTDLLRARAMAAQAPQPSIARPVNCILVWMDGGPSHYEMFDPKPDAPSDIRGQFKPIPTSVPGVHFSECVPNLAKAADKFTVLRSVTHKDPNHGGGNHYMMTGAPTPVPVGCGAFVTFHPSFGSVVSYKRGVQNGLPAYMTLPSITRSGGPNFLGAEHAPFVAGGDPNSKGFKVRDVVLPTDISDARGLARRELRHSLDRMKRLNDAVAEDPAVSFDTFYGQAVDLIASKPAQEAFDISREDDKTRDLYGRNDLGQRMLLARRLVEVGVPFVTVNYGGWDHHRDLFKTCKGEFMQKFDQGMSALITDLDRRGLLESTLVVALGEFGRTPKINKDNGRDHWPGAMNILFAGAGVPRGGIIGATDPKGYYASDNIYSPEDFAVTLYSKLGIDPHQVLHTNTGRPVQLINGGRQIRELFA